MSRTVNTMMNHYIGLKLKVFGDSKLSISKSNMSFEIFDQFGILSILLLR